MEKSRMKLNVVNLEKSYEKKPVLIDASYEFKKGKIYGILGRNGAGKTTMFNCILNNIAPDNGEVIVEFEGGEKRKVTFDDVGFVPAKPALPEFLTGREFLKFFIDVNKSSIKREVNFDEMFALIDFQTEDTYKLIREYSYGMQNKLQILTLLILRPSVILLDEPLTSFDVIASLQMKNLIESIKKDHIIIFSTHILPLAQDLCDEIVILHNGKLSNLDSDIKGNKNFESRIIEMLEGDQQSD